ncbi:MAG TPA: 50S ribosomal protein L15 [Candidatus Atribacteria bacterium]|jgi:large subunit ribosomal protein L15|nr:50S ribosomal protein L15 [Atribacterota bacterium]MDI9607787.1 50S ribosomal protein L15 [Atribacterota bacterium]HOQ50568.1 50S ribosomal protein L15 [Candidatus Atribacteria bacterium]HPT63283.1 50S ribosomal protein L15 [Candidatus Atribacteria bacterium]HQD32815.1 50S ribosomal protein L15 [Candidatus Atribacteria bacterium]
MGVNELKPRDGSFHYRKRVGRGISSGHGKTSGRGHKGQKSRSGGKIPPYFEGGQMPLVRRIPKRGFRSWNRKEWQIINLEALNRFEEGEEVNKELLRKAGLIKKLDLPVKILGGGELTKKLIVKADAFSLSAKEKIEEKGGRAEVV